MKKDIHPKYHSDAKIKCACGNVITVGSTREKMEIEICSACHPFYTGKKKLVDSTGQVDRFKKKMEKTKQMKKATTAKKKAKEVEVNKKAVKKITKKSKKKASKK